MSETTEISGMIISLYGRFGTNKGITKQSVITFRQL